MHKRVITQKKANDKKVKNHFQNKRKIRFAKTETNNIDNNNNNN